MSALTSEIRPVRSTASTPIGAVSIDVRSSRSRAVANRAAATESSIASVINPAAMAAANAGAIRISEPQASYTRNVAHLYPLYERAVLKGGQPTPMPVTVGLSNGRVTEVSGDGVAEGLAVITEQQAGAAP